MSSSFFVSIKNDDLDLAKDPDMDPLNINFNEQSRENNLFFTIKKEIINRFDNNARITSNPSCYH